MICCTRDFSCEDEDRVKHFRAGTTWIDPSHPVFERFPQNFGRSARAVSEIRTRVRPPGRTAAVAEDDWRDVTDRGRMAEQYAEFLREDRTHEAQRWETAATREDRLFWEGTEQLLDSLRPRQDDDDLDDVCDLSDFYADRAEQRLDAIDEAHGPFAAWRR
jgi:hypothetical protein